ncbi:hypothetical protein HDE_06395 [Halotydeus destructor]|nr:hypothetical protein HDE_06395 [Halotydeus destructor]
MVVQLTTQEERVLRPRGRRDYDDSVTCPNSGHTFPQEEASDPYADDDSMEDFIAPDEESSGSSVLADDEYTMEVYSDDETEA